MSSGAAYYNDCVNSSSKITNIFEITILIRKNI